MMQRNTSASTPQRVTAHITRQAKGPRYRVWLGLDAIGATPSLPQARKLAAKTGAAELTECWEQGKAFERTKRGAWGPVC